MCAITLSVVRKCKHELATIEYCKKIQPELDKCKESYEAGEKVTPPHACTESLGWAIFESLSAPVRCKKCVKWLVKKDRYTYGGIATGNGDETEYDGYQGDEEWDNDNEVKQDEQEKKDDDKKIAIRGGHAYRLTTSGPMLPGSPFLRSNRFVGGWKGA